MGSQAFQKDAIYRQMLEYKREKSQLEARLEELGKQYEHYDIHLRTIDAWWLQVRPPLNPTIFGTTDTLKLLQEIELVAEGTFTDKFETHGKLPQLPSFFGPLVTGSFS